MRRQTVEGRKFCSVNWKKIDGTEICTVICCVKMTVQIFVPSKCACIPPFASIYIPNPGLRQTPNPGLVVRKQDISFIESTVECRPTRLYFSVTKVVL